MKQLNKKLIIDNGFWKVFQTSFETERGNGNVITMEKTKGNEGCFILPITKNNEVIFIKEFLFGQDEYQFVFPGGRVEQDSDMSQTLKKELLEETGYKASEFHYLGKYNDNNYIKGKSLLYLGVGCEKIGKQDLKDLEEIEVFKVSLEEFESMIKNNDISCPWTEITFRRAKELTKNFTDFNF